MKDCQDQEPLRFDPVEHRIGEPGDAGAAYVTLHARKHLWELFDRVEGRVNGGQELLAEAAPLFLVPPIAAGQVFSDASPEDDGQSH